MTDGTVDLVILGGGSGGYACALRAAELGMSVVLVEKDKLGGTCLHRGCIPTKALLHAAEVADAARDGARVGVRSHVAGIDMAAVNTYKDGVVGRLHKGLQGLMTARGINTVYGQGRFVGPHSIQVGDGRVTGRHVVLATGSYSKVPPVVELGRRIVTSEQALALDEVPRRVAVLGGGVIGVEFASVWRSFGAEVTVIEALPRLLPNEDEFASKHLERAFRRRGITVHTGVSLTDAKETNDGVFVSLDSGDTVEGDLLLVAVGRGPNTTDHGYEAVGLTLDRGFVVTDERLRTSMEGVYAVGDIVAGLQLAHRGFQQGIFVAEDIAGRSPQPVDETGIPRVTYCEPEVASVGLTEADARAKYGDIDTVVYDLAGNGRSQILQTTGAVKLVKAGARGADGPIIGVHLVGSRVGELIGEAQLVYNWSAEPSDLVPFLRAHPTQSEALGEAYLALAGRPLHARA
jgi:dihydrolipoamide dehydrogenase